MITTRWAKCDHVIGPGTSMYARSIIIGITIRVRTRILEHSRVMRGGASFRHRMIPSAAKLGCVECRACTFTCDHRARVRVCDLQLLWAITIQVCRAARILAITGSANRHYEHSNVVPIHQAHIIEVYAVPGVGGKCKLS